MRNNDDFFREFNKNKRIPSDFKLWFALGALLSIGGIAFAVWAVISIVNALGG